MRHPIALMSFTLATAGLTACVSVPLGDDSSGTTSSGSGHHAQCIDPAELYTNMSCNPSQLDASCPGTQQCFCPGGDFVNVNATCTCQEEDDGVTHWKCAGDCDAGCSGGTTSGSTSSGSGSPHEALCEHLLSIDCPGETTTQASCESQFDELAAMCPAIVEAWTQCALSSPLQCFGSSPLPTNCSDESSALATCQT